MKLLKGILQLFMKKEYSWIMEFFYILIIEEQINLRTFNCGCNFKCGDKIILVITGIKSKSTKYYVLGNICVTNDFSVDCLQYSSIFRMKFILFRRIFYTTVAINGKFNNYLTG